MKKKNSYRHRPTEVARNVAIVFSVISMIVATGVGLIPRRVLRNSTQLQVSLATGSPSGFSVPSRQEVLRFNLTAPSSSDALTQTYRFDFRATDEAGTNWNACDPARFDLYNYTSDGLVFTLEDQHAGTWQIAAANNQTCRVTLRLADADVIPAGQTYQYRLYHDSVGASSVDDDSLQVGILGVVAQMETGRVMRLIGLPVTGNTLVF